MDETPQLRDFAYHVIRYVPNLVRDEWANIGVLLFDPTTGQLRLRLIEDEHEFSRIRRLHPQADEPLLRAMRDNLEDRFETFARNSRIEAGRPVAESTGLFLEKMEGTLSNAVQLSPQKGVRGTDLHAEADRLYDDHVAPARPPVRVGLPGSRATIRNYASQVFRMAGLWNLLEKAVRAAQYTSPGDPMRLDYSYRHNGTRGFVQTLSVSRAPMDCKLLAYTTDRIAANAPFRSEFMAITDVPLESGNERHAFVRETLRDAQIETVPMEGLAVWVAKLKPMLLR